jgi:hypothetical protein
MDSWLSWLPIVAVLSFLVGVEVVRWVRKGARKLATLPPSLLRLVLAAVPCVVPCLNVHKRDALRDRLLGQFLAVYLVSRTLYMIKVYSQRQMHSAQWPFLVWNGYSVAFNGAAYGMWRSGTSRETTALFWGWCYTVQEVFLAFGAEGGHGEGVTASLIWGAGLLYPVLIALVGQSKWAWAMLVTQLLGCFFARRFSSPFLPVELIQREGWTIPANLALLLLAMVSLHVRNAQQVPLLSCCVCMWCVCVLCYVCVLCVVCGVCVCVCVCVCELCVVLT